MPSTRALAILGLSVLAALAPLPGRDAEGQTATATLLLEVRTHEGRPLADVSLSIEHLPTGIVRMVGTSHTGSAVVPLLPAGEYRVLARLNTYRPETVSGLQLPAGGKRVLEITLLPAAFAETVVVTGEEGRATPGGGTVAETFEGQVLVMTPVEDRDFLRFAQLAAGAVPPAPGSRLSTQANTGVNVSGAREAANNFLLDGVDNNDLFLNRIVVTPSLDAVQELTLLHNTYDAEYGRSAGAQVNVVLKSGGSTLRGTAFEYFRDEALDARGVFEQPGEPKPRFSRHQFGGTVGGPVARSQTFYFASVEALRTRSAETRLAQVPTAAQRAGDFAGVPIALADPFTGQPFPGNRIPADRIDAAGARVAALFPDPNRLGPGPNFSASPEGERDRVQVAGKLDRTFRDRHHLTARYTVTADDEATPYLARGRNLPGFGTSILDVGQNAAAGLSQTFGSRVFNELRVGWNRLRRENIALSRGHDAFAELGIRGPAMDDVDRGYPAFTLAGYEQLGDDPNLPVVRRTHMIHVSDAVTLDRGPHQIRFGGEARHYRSNGFNHVFSRGQIAFTGAFTGDALGDLLLGFPTFSFIAANDNPQALRTTAWNVFAQHDWRVSPALTINAGLRYEFDTPPVDAADRMNVFDFDARALRRVGTGGVPRSGVAADRNNFAPRLGFAWQLPGETGLTLRGGYGLYYDSGTLIENSALYFNPPYFDLQTFFPAQELLTLAEPFPAGRGFRPLPSVNTLAGDFPSARTQQGSLGIEGRFIGLDYEVRYTGARGRFLPRRRNINQPAPGPGPLDDRRPIEGFADILVVEPEATSQYDALQVKVERQRPEGLSVRAAYTWGRSLDDASAFLQSAGNDNTPQDARNPGAEWGPSDFDVPHRLSVAALYSVPGDVRAWLRDWHFSALVAVQSGYPFTPRVGSDNSNTGNVGGSFGFDRPNEVPAAGAPPGAVFYDGRAFVVAPPFTFGTAGRNSLRGPAQAAVDLAAARRFRVGDGPQLEARVEIYNALNRANYELPDGFIDRPTFGQSLAAGPPRQVQLAVRFSF